MLNLVIGQTELTFIWNQILDALVDTYRAVLGVSVLAWDDLSVLREGRLRLDTSSSQRGWWSAGTDGTKKF